MSWRRLEKLKTVAEDLVASEQVMLSSAMCANGAAPRLWLHGSSYGVGDAGWLHPFCHGTNNAVTAGLAKVLKQAARCGDIPIQAYEADKYIAAFKSLLIEEATPFLRVTAYVSVMRDAVRPALCFQGGALVLHRDRAELIHRGGYGITPFKIQRRLRGAAAQGLCPHEVPAPL